MPLHNKNNSVNKLVGFHMYVYMMQAVYILIQFITLVNKDFGPWGKTSVFDVFLDAEYDMFPEFLYHPHLLRCIRLCDRTCQHMWVTGGL